MAQPNQLNINNSVLMPPPNTTDIELGSGDKRIILTWLNTNETTITHSDQAATFIIDKRDFLKAFGQLFENSNITIDPVE
jgi:predicted RNA-binding protein (virulence factor B family)